MKKLIIGTALLWATIASLAQIYSANVVGYVGIRLLPGFNLVANPLSTESNLMSQVHLSAPPGTMFYTYSPSTGFSITEYDGDWVPNGNAHIPPGTGYFIRVAKEATMTYVGEVLQGQLSLPITEGFNLVGSMVPESGRLTQDLKYVPSEGDMVYTFDTYKGYSIATYDGGEWVPSEPYIKRAEGFWIRTGTAKNWERNFVVGP
jgi:hypothetical protein